MFMLGKLGRFCKRSWRGAPALLGPGPSVSAPLKLFSPTLSGTTDMQNSRGFSHFQSLADPSLQAV